MKLNTTFKSNPKISISDDIINQLGVSSQDELTAKIDMALNEAYKVEIRRKLKINDAIEVLAKQTGKSIEEVEAMLKEAQKDVKVNKKMVYSVPLDVVNALNIKNLFELNSKIEEALRMKYNIKIDESADFDTLIKEWKKMGLKVD